MADNTPNNGILVDGRHFTFGEVSPLDEFPHLTWKKDDIRFFTGPSSNLKYWKCLYGGTPGGWEAYYSLGGSSEISNLENTIINIINNLPPNIIQGINGKDGMQGPPGLDGTDGEDGNPGVPGEDGRSGKDGLQGPPGLDGLDGQDGEQGIPGEDAITPQQYFDLFLSYGREDGVGTLAAFGTGAEGTPNFYLRPNTDMNVLTVGTGSPGEVWEYEVTTPLNGLLTLDLYVYECLITPQPSTTATITASVTKNTTSILTSPNLDGILTGTRIVVNLSGASYAVGDRIGVHVITTNFSSGTLMMTAHVRCEEITIAANGIIGPPGPPGDPGPPGPTGLTGPPGTNGTNGTNGINAYTTTTANFTQPAVSSNVTINFAQTAWMVINEIIYIATGGYYQCISIGSGTSATMQNLGYPGNASPATVIVSGSGVSPGGLQGPTGSGGGGGITQLLGDVTAGPGSGAVTATNVNAPDGFTHSGKVITTAISAPGTPTTGKAAQYIDITSKNFCSKDDAGIINHCVRTKASVASNFLTSIADDGTVSAAQAGFTDISGTLALSQLGNGTALSVLGRAFNSSGTRADIITSSGSGFALRESGGNIDWGTLATSAYGNNTVTYGKIQTTSAGNVVLGRGNSGAGTVQELTFGTGLSVSGTTITATNPIIATLQLGGSIVNGLHGTGLGTLTQPIWIGQGKEDITTIPLEYLIDNLTAIGATRLKARLLILYLLIDSGSVTFGLSYNGGITFASLTGVTGPGIYSIPNAGGYVSLPSGIGSLGFYIAAGSGYTTGSSVDARLVLQLEY